MSKIGNLVNAAAVDIFLSLSVDVDAVKLSVDEETCIEELASSLEKYVYFALLPYERLHTLLFYSCRVSGHQVPSLAAQPCILLPELKQTILSNTRSNVGNRNVLVLYQGDFYRLHRDKLLSAHADG